MSNTFKKYRKKPVIIEAKLLTEPMDINTLEGTMHANPGDYLINGINEGGVTTYKEGHGDGTTVYCFCCHGIPPTTLH